MEPRLNILRNSEEVSRGRQIQVGCKFVIFDQVGVAVVGRIGLAVMSFILYLSSYANCFITTTFSGVN